MRYLSVCSGIEAATVAWHGLGWTPVGFNCMAWIGKRIAAYEATP
jgi:hypothetical protein